MLIVDLRSTINMYSSAENRSWLAHGRARRGEGPMLTAMARAMWQVYEPIHALTYFAPETRAATDALGLRGGWMGYFAARAAPLGVVPAEVVVATFYNFH